jgi:hypothetical protein
MVTTQLTFYMRLLVSCFFQRQTFTRIRGRGRLVCYVFQKRKAIGLSEPLGGTIRLSVCGNGPSLDLGF